MGRTMATATIIGATETREYEFLVDTGSTFVGLPQSEIEELGLVAVPYGTRETLTQTGVIEQQIYSATGIIDDLGFACSVTESPIPLIGYHLLQTMRYRVNPVTESLERLPPEELGPPYRLIRESYPTG